MQYRVLIVDDEEIECEGMAQLVDWAHLEMELVGTAWNGLEALDKIQEYKPDIVITDIKMPVMNGIELIRRAKKEAYDLEFVVLSGYGDFEFTSQAMQEGIRHYILKPCDENQIVEVLEKIKEELQTRREKSAREDEYKTVIHRLLPRAKEQVFRDMLLDREKDTKDYELFLSGFGDEIPQSVLMAFWAETPFDSLEKFIVQNMLTDFVGEKNLYLYTQIQNVIYCMISDRCIAQMEKAVERIKIELKKLNVTHIMVAISEPADITQAGKLYMQMQELLHIGLVDKIEDTILRYGVFQESDKNWEGLVDYEALRNAQDYEEILGELKLCFLKMQIQEFSFARQEHYIGWIIKILYGKAFLLEQDATDSEREALEGKMLMQAAEMIAAEKGLFEGASKEQLRIKQIQEEIFDHLQQQSLSISYLAQSVLYMNEDYLGRIFLKYKKRKFSEYLSYVRIHMAEKLFRYQPELKISQVAEAVGYAPDGQYFSKTFRKVLGVTPSQFKDSL